MFRLRNVVALIVAYGLGAVSYRQYHLFREPHGPLGKVLHVGVLVPDLDKAIATWRGMGFEKIRILPDSKTVAEYHGRPIETELRKAFVEDMSPQIELMQPVDGAPNPWADELHEQGEVLHHIAYQVPDARAEIEKFRHIGMVEIAGSRTDIKPGELTWSYVKAPDSALIVEFISTAPSR